MPIKQMSAKLINGGLMRGLPAFLVGTSESPDCRDLDPRDPWGATTRPGSASYSGTSGSAGSGVIGRGLFPWIRNNGTAYIFVAAGTTIWSVDTATWFSVFNGIASDVIVQGATLNNLAVIVASGIAPKVSTAGSTLANLAGSAPANGKYVTTYVQKVWIAGDPALPNRVDFSASNSPEDWQTANNAGFATIGDGDGDTIKGIIGTKRAIYILKRNNVYVGLGDSPFNFEFHRLAQIGITSEYGFCSDGQGIWFASDDGIYYASGLNISRMSDALREDYVNGISDKTTISLEVKGEMLFAFHKSSSSSTQNDACFVLAFRRKMEDGTVRGVWGKYTSQNFSIAKLSSQNDLYGVTDASTVQLYKLDTGDATSVSPRWDTPDMDYGDVYARKTLARFFIHGKSPNATTTLTAQWFADGASVGTQYSFAVGTSGSFTINQAAPRSAQTIGGRFLRMRLSWNTKATIYGWKAYADVHVEDDMPRG